MLNTDLRIFKVKILALFENVRFVNSFARKFLPGLTVYTDYCITVFIIVDDILSAYPFPSFVFEGNIFRLAKNQSLIDEFEKRFGRRDAAEIVQYLVPEPRVKEVQHGMLDAADVEVHATLC